jgi:hypothetical protein
VTDAFDPPVVPDDIAQPAMRLADEQDAARGDWPNPRDGMMPAPPWPDEDNPMLRFLLWKAARRIERGMPVNQALLDLAVHAWFEGGVEGYDRGQRDARKPRLIK